MNFDTLLQEAIDLIADVCVLHEGECAECELKEFCSYSKPIEFKMSLTD